MAVVLTILALWGAVYAWGHYTVGGQIDGCLDGGGRWDYEQGRCAGTRAAP